MSVGTFGIYVYQFLQELSEDMYNSNILLEDMYNSNILLEDMVFNSTCTYTFNFSI